MSTLYKDRTGTRSQLDLEPDDGDYCNLGENYEIFYLLLSRYYRQYNVEKVLLLMSDEINL